MSIPTKVKGCQLLMPETVFLKDGKFDTVVTMDKESCLQFDNKTNHINMQLRMKFEDIVRDRRKETQSLAKKVTKYYANELF